MKYFSEEQRSALVKLVFFAHSTFVVSLTMNSSECLDQAQLLRLLDGKVDLPSSTLLENHLLECDRCSNLADTLFPMDEVTAVRRSVVIESSDPKDEAIVRELIDRAKTLRSDVQTIWPEQTQLGGEREDNDSHGGIAHRVVSHDSAALDISFFAAAEQPDELGRLGGYRVLEVLGSGGMGVVFRAEDPRLKRYVALKAMKPAIASNKDAKARFLKEAEAAAAIEHDNIVTIYQVGEDRGVPFIAMQFLKGESLQKRIDRKGKLTQNEVLRIGREIAIGLQAAHSQGLIHRDIKPDNIWLQEDRDRVRILDFGLVRNSAEDVGLTQTGVVLGTPKYMAPEQARGKNVDHRCDLFSLGSVLYRLVAGQAPFEGSNLTATLIAVAHEEPTPLLDVVPDVNLELAELIMQLLAKDRSQRPQSASAVSQRLLEIEKAFINPTTAAAESADTLSYGILTGVVPIADVTIVARPVLRQNPPRPPNGKKRALAGGAGGLLLMLGILIITIRNKDGKETTIRVPDGVVADIDVQPGSKVSIREEAASDTDDTKKMLSAIGSKSAEGVKSILESAAKSERELAAWLLAKPGMELRLDASDGIVIHVATGGTLPTADFVVSSIAWPNAAEITDDDLAQIGLCQGLSVLTLGYPLPLKITDKGLDALLSPTVCRTLKQLTLGKMPSITHDGYLTINRATKLLLLSLRDVKPPADGKFFAELRLPKLTDLLVWEGDFSGGWLAAFAEHSPDMAHLVLQGVRVTPADVTALARLDLENLGLENAGLSDAELNVIGSMRKLKILSVRENPAITDAGVRSLGECKELQTLLLSSASLTDAACDTIATLPVLDSVVLDNTRITDAGLDRLTANTKLSFLGLQGCKRLTDAGLESVTKMTTLKVLEIRDNPQFTSVTKAGIEAFQRRIPWCKVISDFGVLDPRQDMTSVLRESSSLTPAEPAVWPVGPLPYWAEKNVSGTILKQGYALPGIVERPSSLPGIGRWNVDTVQSRGAILVARYSPDGKWMATGSNDGHVRVYDAGTMKLHRLLPGTGGAFGVADLAWHPDSDRIAVACDSQRTLRIWSVSGRLDFEDHGIFFTSVAWTHDGSRLICGSHHRLEVRAVDGSVLKTIIDQENAGCTWASIAVSPDSPRFVCWHQDGVRIWNAESFEIEQELKVDGSPRHSGHSVDWSSKDRIALFLLNTVLVMDSDRKTQRKFEIGESYAAAWHPDGDRLVVWRDSTFLMQLDTVTGEMTPEDRRMSADCGIGPTPTALCWSPDGKHLAAGAGRLLVCNEQLTETHFDSGATNFDVSGISLSPDGTQIATATVLRDSSVRIWSQNGTFLSNMLLNNPTGGHFGRGIAWSPAGNRIACVSISGNGLMVGAPGGELRNVAGTCVSLSWSPDGQRLAVGLRNGHVLITDPDGQTLEDIDTGETGDVTVGWSKQDVLVAHAGLKILRLELGKGKPVVKFIAEAPVKPPEGRPAVWRPDGQEVCFVACFFVSLADGLTDRVRLALDAAAWAPDGSRYLHANGGSLSLNQPDGTQQFYHGENGSHWMAAGAWHPSGDTIFVGYDQSLLMARNAEDLHVKWTAVMLPEQKSLTFHASGSILDGKRSTLEQQLVYYTADAKGNVDLLTPLEFELRSGQEVLPVPGRYFDAEYGFSINTGDAWKPAPLESVTVPGIARAAFSRAGGVSLNMFVQETGDLVDASWMLAESAKAQEEKLSATVLEKEVRKIAGRDAMWMIVEGPGTGTAIDGKGPVKTTQHWIAIPRETDVVVALLTSPSGTFASHQTLFLKAIETLKLRAVTSTP